MLVVAASLLLSGTHTSRLQCTTQTQHQSRQSSTAGTCSSYDHWPTDDSPGVAWQFSKHQHVAQDKGMDL